MLRSSTCRLILLKPLGCNFSVGANAHDFKKVYDCFVNARAILGLLMTVLLASVSVSSASCDLSCSFDQLSANCEHSAKSNTSMQMSMEMRMPMTGMAEAHSKNRIDLAQKESRAIHASSSMNSCPHQPCDKPVTLFVQSVRLTAPHLVHVFLTAFCDRQPDNLFFAAHDWCKDSFRSKPSALDPLTTSLRI